MALGIWRKFKEYMQRVQNRWSKSEMKPLVKLLLQQSQPLLPSLMKKLPGGDKIAPAVQKALPLLGQSQASSSTTSESNLTPGETLKELAQGASDYAKFPKI